VSPIEQADAAAELLHGKKYLKHVLTPDQRRKWDETMALFAWTAPGFRHLMYKLLSNNDGGYGPLITLDIETAATDGSPTS
jgi:hypothetical protein